MAGGLHSACVCKTLPVFSSRWLPVSSVLLLAVAGCAGQDEPADPAPSPSMVTSGAAPATPTTPSASERLGLTTGWGPTRRQLDRAARAVRDLSLEQLAGQTIVARYDGTAAPTALVRDLHLGGVVVFSDNIGSTDQIRDVNEQLRREVRRDWPLWVSVDQEGGVVQRVEGRATRFPAFMSAGAADEADLTRAAAAAMGAELRGLGFNVDFAPIADVTTGPDDPTIGSRSAGSDPALVARHARAAASGLQGAGVLPVVKHFPGHGSVAADSHETLPVQTRTQAQLAERDLVPFREAVAAGSRRSWSPTSPCGQSTRGCRRRCRTGSSPARCATASASTAWSSPTPWTWPGWRRPTTARPQRWPGWPRGSTSC